MTSLHACKLNKQNNYVDILIPSLSYFYDTIIKKLTLSDIRSARSNYSYMYIHVCKQCDILMCSAFA